MDVKNALELVDEIVNIIDEEIPEKAWDRAASFFEDIREKVIDVGQTIRTNDKVSERQMRALEGWKAGVSKWLPN